MESNPLHVLSESMTVARTPALGGSKQAMNYDYY